MEDTMTDRYPHDDATRDDLRIQARWARKLAVVYGVALLLLVAFIAANRMLVESKAAPGLAGSATPHIAHAPAGRIQRAD
jgi:hypothetical protein